MASKDGFVERCRMAGSPSGLLHGLRLAVKDNIQVDGLPFTAGHPLFNKRKAQATATCVQWLMDAGVTVVGATITDAGGFGVTTPDVINPRTPHLIAGGSSGGAAVAVATSNADLGIGTDTAGSIRIPAACCGLYAFKPSFGILPLDRVWPLSRSFDHIGLLASELDPLVVAARFMLDRSPISMREKKRARTARIGVERQSPRFRSDWTTECFEKATDQLRDAGHTIVRVDLPDRADCITAHGIITLYESSQIYACLSEGEKAMLGKPALSALRAAKGLSGAKLQWARDTVDRIRFETATMFGKAELFLLPTLAMRPPALKEKVVAIRGQSMSVLHALVFETCLFNICGLPVVSIPVGKHSAIERNDIPFSVQIVGAPSSDYDLLASAIEIDTALNA